MWKTFGVFLCILIATTVALDSNSSLLETKVFRKSSKINIREPIHMISDQSMFEWLVSIAVVQGLNLFHICLGNLISANIVVSVTECGNDEFIIDLTGLPRRNEHLYVNYNRRIHYKIDDSISVDMFMCLYDYVNDVERRRIAPNARDIAILKLKEKVPSFISPLSIEAFEDEIVHGEASLIGYNFLEFYYLHTPEMLISMPVTIMDNSQCKTANLDITNRFCFKLKDDNYILTKHDLGGLVFSGGKLFGIITNIELGIFTKFSSYKKFIYLFKEKVDKCPKLIQNYYSAKRRNNALQHQ